MILAQPDLSGSQLPAGQLASVPWLQVLGSRHFMDWLQECNVSLGFTTYQTGKLFLIGRKPDDAISVFERTFSHCMGLWASPDARTLWLSSKFQMWRFERAPAQAVPHRGTSTEGDSVSVPAWSERGYDFVYVPRVGYTTGDIDAHDVAVDASGRVIFVSTLFGCLATVSETSSFQPLWRPSFLSALVPEDRCHLNGLAMRDGQPAFVTVCRSRLRRPLRRPLRASSTRGWRSSEFEPGIGIPPTAITFTTRGENDDRCAF